ncbi:MAG: MATE family efflux transporter, partial [Lachnospiraceae bacterium]|nr:MATE family efflux transporter [Lachnospiraceae bacterium]
NIVDSIFVAKMGEDALAAVSLVYPLQNLITAWTVGFGVGLNARIAYFLGAGKQKSADCSSSQGILLGTLHGIVVTILGLAFAPFYLQMFTGSQTVLRWGTQYAQIIFAMSTVLIVSVTFEKVFQAVGKMVPTMAGMMAGCVANIILDPLLIFGIGVFPKMGVRGAAVATTLGWVVTLVFYLVYYFTGKIALRIRFRDMRPTREICAKMYQVGVPAALNMALPSFLISALNGILSVYSQMYVVILGIYYKLQSFIYLPANGIIQGMRPLISYNYGAREHERVQKIFRICLKLIAGMMCIGMALCIFFPENLMEMFTGNGVTIEKGVVALRMISFGFIASSISVVCAGALEALGKGLESLCISLLRYLVVILPSAFILSRVFRENGVWGSFIITEIVAAFVAAVIWKKVKKKNELESQMED